MDLENIAGQTLLRLVARGSAIVAELLRLSDHIPSVFLGTDPLEAAKYAGILHDFKYLKTPEIVDEKIDSNPDLLELDEEFRETHMQLLERFYKLFDSILKYHHDYTVYVEELTEGVFVQHTVESVIQDSEGGQLMAEAVYLLGVMLLLMDLRIPGYVRERMVVSFYRYKGAATVPNIDEIVKLCRTTGFGLGPNDKRPLGYPESFFERFAMPKLVVEMIIGRLRSDDVYNRTAAYPAPEHRSTALASQAAMLYVILFFAPSILHTKSAIMREIVDKHFSDNWVVPFYMGHLVDLSDMWEPYKAAKAALSNILERANVQEIMERQVANMARLNEELRKYLTQGVLLEDYVLDNLRKLLHCLRSCNATLRWLMLHRTTSHKKFRELIQKSVDPNQLLMLMLNTAQFESVLKDLFQSLLATKEKRWVECQKEASGRMLELSEYFSGEKALTRVAKNEKLQNWFRELSGVIDNLSFADPTAAGRKISALNTALQEVEEFHQIETNLQVKQFLGDTRQFLTKMVRTANVLDKTLAEIILIAEFSYSFNIIDDYSQMIHLRIRNNPAIVLLLRATFLKLSSILEAPMVRIVQCESKDSESVAQYFSSSLVLYVRKILDVIPRSVFTLLHEITKLTTSTLKAVPTKLERLLLKDFAQLPERYGLAKATHQVSVFTAGILGMKTTLVGIVQLDPKQLLEDGIRKQLVQQICVAMHEQIVFKTGKLDEFESRVGALGQRLEGLKSSIEYIQDYINLFGLKIWQKELSRIIAYYVEQESNTFLKKQVYDWQSTFQSDAIPIPRFPRIADKANNQHLSENFMGRLVRELLQQTDPRRTVFVESMQGWYDAQNREAIGIRTFDLLNRSVGVFGLTGADRLICFMIVRDLQSFLRQYRKTLDQGLKVFVQKLMHQLHPTSQFPADPAKLYSVALGYTQKMFPVFLEYITKIGQAQLVRRMIANELNFCCKMDSKVLACALEGLNDGLIIDIQAHYSKPESKAYPGDRLLAETTKFLDAAGIADPMTKIYVTTDPLEGVPAMLFLFVLSQIPRLSWDASLCTLVCREKNDPLDGAPFVIGVITLLKQFHSNHTQTFLAYLGQYVRSTISLNASKGTGVFPAEVITVLVFLEEFCRFSKLPRVVIEAYIPSYIFDRFFHAPS